MTIEKSSTGHPGAQRVTELLRKSMRALITGG